jgi:hypothetical protein
VAKTGKITITVNSSTRQQVVDWRGVGSFGSLNLSATGGTLRLDPLVSATTSDLFWKAIIDAVSAQL